MKKLQNISFIVNTSRKGDLMVKFKPQQVKAIYTGSQTTKYLANKYNVSRRCIYNIRYDKTYKSITQSLEKGYYPKNKNFTPSQVKDIYESSLSTLEMACKYHTNINNIYSIRQGRTYKEITHHLSQGDYEKYNASHLTDAQVIDIYTSNETHKTMAQKYQVNRQLIYNIRSNQRYQRLTKNLKKGSYKYSPQHKISDSVVRHIYTSPQSTKEIVKETGVHQPLVSAIRSNRRYTHVTQHLKQPEYKNRPKRLNDDVVKDIYTSVEPSLVMAQKYNISPTRVYLIRSHYSHRKITRYLKQPTYQTGHAKSHEHLSEEDVKNIFFASDTLRNIAQKYDISEDTVSRIKYKKTYRDVTQDLTHTKDSLKGRRLPKEAIMTIYNTRQKAREIARLYHRDERFIRNVQNGKMYNYITKHH